VHRAMAPVFLCFAGFLIIMSTQGTLIFSDTSGGDQISLVDILDHVLNQGVILRGNLIISLAGVDLVYVGLDVILTSVETALRHIAATSQPPRQAT